MTTKVASPQKFLEIIGQTYRVELDNTACKLLDPAWMDIPMNIVLRMQILQSNYDLVKHVKSLIRSECLFTK